MSVLLNMRILLHSNGMLNEVRNVVVVFTTITEQHITQKL
jgi:hypothetical protein